MLLKKQFYKQHVQVGRVFFLMNLTQCECLFELKVFPKPFHLAKKHVGTFSPFLKGPKMIQIFVLTQLATQSIGQKTDSLLYPKYTSFGSLGRAEAKLWAVL